MKIMLKMATGLMVLISTTLSQAQMKPADVAAAQSAFSANGCTNCHDASSRIVGPSLKEIAARYASKNQGKKVSAEVAKRIIEGSEGRWGDMAHPSNAALDPADAALLARWILAGAP